MNWNKYFFEICKAVSLKSKDKSIKIGCIIVGPANEIRSTGYNGFPRKVNDNIKKRHKRPLKYQWTEHAEKNAIYSAARVGTPLENCIIYCQWMPCHECARAIIQSGIKKIFINGNFYGKNLWKEERWKESFEIAKQMFKEAKILCKVIK